MCEEGEQEEGEEEEGEGEGEEKRGRVKVRKAGRVHRALWQRQHRRQRGVALPAVPRGQHGAQWRQLGAPGPARPLAWP